MTVFIKCVCDKNLSALCYEGFAPAKEINEAWLIILSEYYETKGIIENERWHLTVDIKRLQSHLTLVDLCVNFLKIKYSEATCEALTRLGYRFKPVDHDPAKYGNALNVVVQRSKQKFIQLQKLMKDLEKLIEEEPDTLPTRDDFEAMLINLEEMQRTEYSYDSMTVQKFLLLEKKYIRKIELMQQRADKAKF